MAQASFDAYMLPRHIGLYAGVPIEVPAYQVQRVCGTGIEVICRPLTPSRWAAVELALCVGTESMSRNPVAAYTHRGGFRMGQVEFKDFLWEALIDPAPAMTMGDTAEKLARSTRSRAPRWMPSHARSFERALAAQKSGFLAGEITPVKSKSFPADGFKARSIKLQGCRARGRHPCAASSVEALAKIKPAFGGVQTGGQQLGHRRRRGGGADRLGGLAQARDQKPLWRASWRAAVGVPPEIMGIGPAPAIRSALEQAGLELCRHRSLRDQRGLRARRCLACEQELGLDRTRLNVNGGAIAIGHPLGATGARIALTLARELGGAASRYGIASACIGGGQGIALLIENPDATDPDAMDKS